MEYLNNVLDIKTEYMDESFDHLPNYIYSRYNLQKVKLDGVDAIFVLPKDKLDAIDQVKKHLTYLERNYACHCVLVLNELPFRQREYLLKERIPFIVENKQIYLPFMATYIQNNRNKENKVYSHLLPSAQKLLLFFIYQGCHDMYPKQASDRLALTPMSISRASRQLQELGLIELTKDGVNHVMHSDCSPKELFQNAQKYLLNPVKKVIYIPKESLKQPIVKSGYSALATYSLLQEPDMLCVACEHIGIYQKQSTNQIFHTNEQICVEHWKYSPINIVEDESVDPLSLYLSLRNDHDERVQKEIDSMLTNLWREIDEGKYQII